MRPALTSLSRGRLAAAPVVAVLASLAMAGAMAADSAMSLPPRSDSQRLQQRFASAVEGWRKAVLKYPEIKAHEALVRELRVVVAPTPVPLLRVQRRLEGSILVVSVGWLVLLDELLRAEATSALVAGNAACLSSYEDVVLAVVQHNRERARHPPQPLQAWPRLRSLIESGEAPAACKALTPGDLRSPAVKARVAADFDAAALWLLTRQAWLLIELPQPKAAAVARATATTVESKPLAASEDAGRSQAASLPASVSERAELHAQQLLDGFGLRPPEALCWLRNYAADLFDDATVQALARRPSWSSACWSGTARR